MIFINYHEILKAIRDSRREYLMIEYFEDRNGEYRLTDKIALIDTETSKNDIMLWFPKEKNGILLEDFVKNIRRHSIIASFRGNLSYKGDEI